jgi:hypothetical protein
MGWNPNSARTAASSVVTSALSATHPWSGCSAIPAAQPRPSSATVSTSHGWTRLGDGDHGDNMAIGLQAIRELLDTTLAKRAWRVYVLSDSTRHYGRRRRRPWAPPDRGRPGSGERALPDWPLTGRCSTPPRRARPLGRCVVGDKTILDTLRPWPTRPWPATRSATLMAAWRGMRSSGSGHRVALR